MKSKITCNASATVTHYTNLNLIVLRTTSITMFATFKTGEKGSDEFFSEEEIRFRCHEIEDGGKKRKLE